MKTSSKIIVIFIALGLLTVTSQWGGAGFSASSAPDVQIPLAAASSLQNDLKSLCGCLQAYGPPAPTLDPTVIPVDVSLEDNIKCKSGTDCPSRDGCCQPCFDCYGWQLFVALNWPAKTEGMPDPSKPFGRPGDYSDIVWQQYKSAFDVFGDSQPTPWGTNDALKLQLNSAVIKETFLKYDLQSDHNWLTDQDGTVVRYDIRVNKDEYEYILKNDLWHQEGLFKFVSTGPGVVLPSRKSEYGEIGAMEVKAAWRLIPESRRAYFEQNYKVAHAKVYDPKTRTWKDHDVALVGLHIIKKTPNSPQWVWSTFEHKDNAPLQGDSGRGTKWNFFNPDAPSSYKPNYDAPPSRDARRDAPTQVVRVKQASSDDGDATKINDAMHRLIAEKFPNSVWRNYNLISVQWPRDPNNPKPDPKAQKVLPSGQPRPRVLANTAMETYQQSKNSGGAAGLSPGARNDQGPENSVAAEDLGKSSCIACHRISAVTPNFVNHPSGKGWWTDYSTLFFKAGVKKTSKSKN